MLYNSNIWFNRIKAGFNKTGVLVFFGAQCEAAATGVRASTWKNCPCPLVALSSEEPTTCDHLMVKPNLRHLSKVPGSSRKDRHQKRAETKELPGARKQELKRKATDAREESL